MFRERKGQSLQNDHELVTHDNVTYDEVHRHKKKSRYDGEKNWLHHGRKLEIKEESKRNSISINLKTCWLIFYLSQRYSGTLLP